MPGEVRHRRISATALPDRFGDGYHRLGEDEPKQRRKSSTVLPDGVENEGRSRSFSATALALPKKVFDEVKSRRKSATVLPKGVGDDAKPRRKSATVLPDGVVEPARSRTGSLLAPPGGGEEEIKPRRKSVTRIPDDIQDESRARAMSSRSIPEVQEDCVKPDKMSITTNPEGSQAETQTVHLATKHEHVRFAFVNEALDADDPDNFDVCLGPEVKPNECRPSEMKPKIFGPAEERPKIFGPASAVTKSNRKSSDDVQVDLGSSPEESEVVGSHPQFNRSPSTTELVGTVVKPQNLPSYGTTNTGPDNNNSPVGGFNVNALILSIKGDETTLHMISQIILPFIIAGFGMVGAGMVLDIVQHWDVFDKVDEVFILVPALLGLKGNLGMTLASRLSTHAHLGHLDNRKQMLKIIGGNMCLVQAQAIVVGFLAALTAMIMAFIFHGTWNMQHGLLLCAASAFTSSIPTFIQCMVMATVVILSRKYHINPDNVATPISGSFGDLVTLSLLAWFGNIIYLNMVR